VIILERNEMVKYRSVLLGEKNRINETIDKMKEHSNSDNMKAEISELSVVDNHPADMGTEMFDKERNYALMDNEKNIVNQIDKALKRIEEGVYGKCVLCGEEIQKERINFMPYVLTCIDCERNKPNNNTYIYDRPQEEAALASYGKYFMNSTDENKDENKYEVSYNAKDSWQDVDKFNAREGIERDYDGGNGEEEEPGITQKDDGAVEFIETISNQQYKEQLP
jgi:YteA family regulatory protein